LTVVSTVASADLSEPFVDEVLPAARVNTPLVSMLGSMHAATFRDELCERGPKTEPKMEPRRFCGSAKMVKRR
jgi:hypothetical protein